MKRVTFLVMLFLVYSCSQEKKYVNEAIDIMEENSIKKNLINWNEFRNENLKKIKKTDTKKDIYKIISEALLELNDNHSFLLLPEVEKEMYKIKKYSPSIASAIYKDSIGYVRIPQFVGNDSLVYNFASEIQEKIKKLDTSKLEYWIVDLRDNFGGNMYPMILGLSTLLKDGIYGYFSFPDDSLVKWKLKENSFYLNDESKLKIENQYKIENQNPKIAILINENTASSGEATALIFKGVKDVKFFGKRTFGLSTSNDLFELSDGVKLVLTTSYLLDRNKNKYEKYIEPDVYSEEPLVDAMNWLLPRKN